MSPTNHKSDTLFLRALLDPMDPVARMADLVSLVL